MVTFEQKILTLSYFLFIFTLSKNSAKLRTTVTIAPKILPFPVSRSAGVTPLDAWIYSSAQSF